MRWLEMVGVALAVDALLILGAVALGVRTMRKRMSAAAILRKTGTPLMTPTSITTRP